MAFLHKISGYLVDINEEYFEEDNVFKEGELIKYMMPLDADYSYGVITELKKGRAEVV